MAKKKSEKSTAVSKKNSNNSATESTRKPSSRLEVDSGKYTVTQQQKSNAKKQSDAKSSAKAKDSGVPKQIQRLINLDINWDIAARIAFCLVTLILIAFLFSFQRVETQTALLVTISKSIETSGYAVRDESIITTTKNGTFVSTVENGSKVSKGETVVNVFASGEEAAAYQRVLEINQALEDFELMKTAGEDNAAEISVIQKQMENNLLSFSKNVAAGNISGACELSDDILYYFNKNQIATKVVEDFSKRVQELRNERSELMSKYSLSPDTVSTSISGYFIDTVDGYENILDSSVLEGLTPTGLEQLVARHSAPNTAGVVGKIADGYTWHIVCIVKAEEAAMLKKDRNYSIAFPYSDADQVKAKLVAISPDENEERVLLTFRCTTMVSELSTLRYQQMIIQLDEITGIEIDKDCLVTRIKETQISDSDAIGGYYSEYEEQLGVYILWDNEIKFKRVEIIHEMEDKVVCSISNTGASWLKLYDEVILDTENMYEGKIINNGR